MALNTEVGGGGRSVMSEDPTDGRQLLVGRGVDDKRLMTAMTEEVGFSFSFFFFLVTTLVHSYCFFLHISDKRGALRTVLCEKRGKRKRRGGGKKTQRLRLFTCFS